MESTEKKYTYIEDEDNEKSETEIVILYDEKIQMQVLLAIIFSQKKYSYPNIDTVINGNKRNIPGLHMEMKKITDEYIENFPDRIGKENWEYLLKNLNSILKSNKRQKQLQIIIGSFLDNRTKIEEKIKKECSNKEEIEEIINKAADYKKLEKDLEKICLSNEEESGLKSFISGFKSKITTRLDKVTTRLTNVTQRLGDIFLPDNDTKENENDHKKDTKTNSKESDFAKEAEEIEVKSEKSLFPEDLIKGDEQFEQLVLIGNEIIMMRDKSEIKYRLHLDQKVYERYLQNILNRKDKTTSDEQILYLYEHIRQISDVYNQYFPDKKNNFGEVNKYITSAKKLIDAFDNENNKEYISKEKIEYLKQFDRQIKRFIIYSIHDQYLNSAGCPRLDQSCAIFICSLFNVQQIVRSFCEKKCETESIDAKREIYNQFCNSVRNLFSIENIEESLKEIPVLEKKIEELIDQYIKSQEITKTANEDTIKNVFDEIIIETPIEEIGQQKSETTDEIIDNDNKNSGEFEGNISKMISEISEEKDKLEKMKLELYAAQKEIIKKQIEIKSLAADHLDHNEYWRLIDCISRSESDLRHIGSTIDNDNYSKETKLFGPAQRLNARIKEFQDKASSLGVDDEEIKKIIYSKRAFAMTMHVNEMPMDDILDGLEEDFDNFLFEHEKIFQEKKLKNFSSAEKYNQVYGQVMEKIKNVSKLTNLQIEDLVQKIHDELLKIYTQECQKIDYPKTQAEISTEEDYKLNLILQKAKKDIEAKKEELTLWKNKYIEIVKKYLDSSNEKRKSVYRELQLTAVKYLNKKIDNGDYEFIIQQDGIQAGIFESEFKEDYEKKYQELDLKFKEDAAKAITVFKVDDSGSFKLLMDQTSENRMKFLKEYESCIDQKKKQKLINQLKNKK